MRIRGYAAVLQEKFSHIDVANAFLRYCEDNADLPAPADLAKIISPPPPPKPRPTTAQYIAALDYQKRNGYPAFSYQASIIAEYEAAHDEALKSYDKQEELREMALAYHGSNALMIEGGNA